VPPAKILLINPPVAKPTEPPAGIARLAGALELHGVPFRLLDGNLEAVLHLLERQPSVSDTWTRRAWKHRDANRKALYDLKTYGVRDRYVRAVNDLNRLLVATSRESGAVAGLADYDDPSLSPVRSADLIAAAERFDRSVFFPWFSRRLPELLDGVEMVGFSLNYLSQALPTFAMIGFLRKVTPHVPVILGGGLVTSWVQRSGWRSPFDGLVHHLVAGPGEGPLLSLCGIDGCSPGPAIPRYDLLPLQDYLSPGLILPYSAASGCYWNRCSFCPEQAEGGGYRPLPVAQAVTELHALRERWRPALIHLLDSAVSPALLQALVDSPPGAPWYGFARMTGALEDPGFCRALRRSGCVMLKLGLESGDQGVLDQLHKGIDLAAASRILGNLREAGIAVYLYLLFGTPAEGEAEARRTLDFVVRHRDAVNFLNLALFNMPVNAADAKELARDDFYEGDLSLYTAFRHPQGWERRDVRRFMNSVFMRHPAVAEIVRNDPPFFTSNHAPFFTAGFQEPGFGTDS